MWWGMDSVIEDDDKIGSEQAKQVIRRAIAMLRPYRKEVVLGAVVMVLGVLCLLAGPAFLRFGIDHGLGGSEGRLRADPDALNKAAIAFLAVSIATIALARAQILLFTRVGEKFLRDLRIRVFDHIQSMSMAFFDREQAGKLVARMTSDIDSLQELVQQGLVMFITSALLLVLSVVVLVSMSPLLSLICIVAIPLVAVASIWFRRESNRAYLAVRDRIGQTLTLLQEGLSGVRVIQAFGREELQERRFNSRNDAQLDAQMTAIKISAFYFPVIELSGVATTAAVIGIGGVMVEAGYASLGTVAAFVFYLANLFEPIQVLSQLFNVLQSAGAALTKIFGLLDTRSPIAERVGAVDLPTGGGIEVRDLGFAYDGRNPVLTGVNLTIAPGERIALVGPTGAGKSTLAKLIARLYDPTEGSISFGGVDLRDTRLSSLRSHLCVVPQEGFLFSGTILDNVRIGRAGASDEEVRAAMALIGVEKRFAALPEGLQTEVRERGSRLSAGERQLVSLARAALAAPEVLVLDEATSNLDPGTEADVEAAMVALMEGRTVIVIAHRLTTAARADRVAVVDDGGLVEVGTHDELVAQGGRYAAMFATWSGQATAPVDEAPELAHAD
ncbi:MAG TPA: ABC transporter ATP-binding protein [Acidimicrobiales bacterium]|nr:ABC transporter ATP-binding protein [Acidimicrobiales bacterium]